MRCALPLAGVEARARELEQEIALQNAVLALPEADEAGLVPAKPAVAAIKSAEDITDDALSSTEEEHIWQYDHIVLFEGR